MRFVDRLKARSLGSQTRWVFVAMGLIFLLALIASVLFSTMIDGVRPVPAQRMESGWYQLENGGRHILPVLPCTIESDSDTVVLQHALTEDMIQDNDVIAFRAHYTKLRVWVDDRLVYTSPAGEEKIPSSTWHFIPISSYHDARMLTVEVTNPYDNHAFWIDTPMLDAPGAIRDTLLQENYDVFFFSFACLLLTVGLLVCALVLRHWRSPGYLQLLTLAAFVFLSGQWVLLDSKVLTIFGGNLALPYFLNHAAFFLLPAPFLLYIRLITSDCRRIINVLIWATLINAAVSLILHVTGLVPLIYTIVLVHVLIVLSVFASGVAFWRSVVTRREKRLRLTFCGMLIVYVCVLVSLVMFNMGLLSVKASSFYIIGLSLLLACMAFDALSQFGRFWRMKDHTERYRRLAVEDSMTGMSNRNAFQMHMNALLDQPPEQLALVVFDVDNLKQINDQQGHQTGDRAICAAALLIRTVFDTVGSCYRTGGDEFEVIVEGRDVSLLPSLLHYFADELSHSWDETLPSDGVSYGWAEASFNSDSPLTTEALADLRETADQSLYRNKHDNKSA